MVDKTLLASPFVGAATAVCFCLLLYFTPSLPVWTLFIPKILSGLTGGLPALITGGFSYAVDISHEGSSRTIRIVTVNVCIAVGFGTAGLLSGLLIAKGVPYYVCYATALSMATLGFLYTVFVLKETRCPNRHYTLVQAIVEVFRIHQLVDSLRAMGKKRSGWGRVNLWLLFAVFLVDFVIFMGELTLSQKFLTASPVSWSLGYFLLFDGLWKIIGMVAVGLFTGVAKRYLHWSDTTLGVGRASQQHIFRIRTGNSSLNMDGVLGVRFGATEIFWLRRLHAP